MFDTTTANRIPIALMVAAVLALSGCSGAKSADSAAASAAPTGDSAGTTPASTDTPSAAADAGSSSTASDVDAYDPCTKLTVADVQPLYSAPITMTKETDLTMFLRGCIFATAAHRSQLQVLVTTTPSLAQGNWSYHLTKNGVAAKPMSGIGDKAMRDPDDVSIYAMKGNVYCSADDDVHTRPQLRGAEAYDGKPLPDAVAQPIAEKLGALCQKIFGS